MLVLANGAFKSGSSWLREILLQLHDFEPVPPEYRSPAHSEPWLASHRLDAFLESGVYRDADMLSKSHLFGDEVRTLLLSHDDVRVFDITRDLRDTIVSYYFHFNRVYDLDWEFSTFYWRVGRYKAHQIGRYHATWAAPSPAVFVASYEGLKTDFAGEVRRIADFLGLSPSDEEIERIRRATSLERLQKERGQDELPEEKRFFRRGAVGEWNEHFSERALRDLERIERRGLGPVGMLAYHAIFTVRPALRNALRGLSRPRRNAALS